MSKRIMFTGGSGKAGRYAIQYLVEQGHQVLNLDSVRLDNPKVRTLITDITDSGQVFNALTSYMGLHEFDPDLRPQPVDAVVHFAAIPRTPASGSDWLPTMVTGPSKGWCSKKSRGGCGNVFSAFFSHAAICGFSAS